MTKGVLLEQKTALEVSQISCSFGSLRALDDFSLRIPKSTVVGIVGPNGAGKTTLIDVICGLLTPSQGTVKIFGQSVAQKSVRSQIGVLPQETALYDEVSALQNLRFAASLYNVPNANDRISQVLDLVGLKSRAKDIVRGFSGGMQRRLAIARALLHDPPFLILDEPTIGVDVEARHQIWGHIRSLKASGRTVLLTTNYLDEAEALCDRVVIMGGGRLIAEDTPSALAAKTGQCLELECSKEGAVQLKNSMGQRQGVLRSEMADFGLRIYLGVNATPEDFVHAARSVCKIDGFRTRSPDLVEVFRSLTATRPSP